MRRLVQKYGGGYEEYIVAKKLKETSPKDVADESPSDNTYYKL